MNINKAGDRRNPRALYVAEDVSFSLFSFSFFYEMRAITANSELITPNFNFVARGRLTRARI